MRCQSASCFVCLVWVWLDFIDHCPISFRVTSLALGQSYDWPSANEVKADGICAMALGRRNFSGVKRTCWTTGSWRSCLSLEFVSSIPAGSTIIYRFLCGFICVSLCQSTKIKPTNIKTTSYQYRDSHHTLRWRHNGRNGVSNHQHHDCLLNRLFRRRSKKTSKLRVTGRCAGNSPGTCEFPAQMASNAENNSISWRHHDNLYDGNLYTWKDGLYIKTGSRRLFQHKQARHHIKYRFIT